MNLSIEFIATLLLIAAIVAMTVRRLKVPYTVGLMLTGIVLAISPFPTDDVEITKDLIFTILLPPLIYEAAIYIKWQELRRDLSVILTLATVGVLLSAYSSRDALPGRMGMAERDPVRRFDRCN
jgi:CPA1 family monovalent cation:H+ antiporter